MAETRTRPLSPHLSIWRWGPGMTVSILHRITGAGLSILGLAVLTWWLTALADGPEAYNAFLQTLTWKPLGIPVALIVLIGLTWAIHARGVVCRLLTCQARRQQQRDAGHAFAQPMLAAFAGRAEPAHLAERGRAFTEAHASTPRK